MLVSLLMLEIYLRTKMTDKTNGNGKYIYFSQIKSDVLKYIGKYIKEKSYSPTQIEIAKKFRFSRSRAGKILQELKSLGFIEFGKSAHRKIRLTSDQLVKTNSRAFNKEYPVYDRQM